MQKRNGKFGQSEAKSLAELAAKLDFLSVCTWLYKIERYLLLLNIFNSGIVRNYQERIFFRLYNLVGECGNLVVHPIPVKRSAS